MKLKDILTESSKISGNTIDYMNCNDLIVPEKFNRIKDLPTLNVTNEVYLSYEPGNTYLDDDGVTHKSEQLEKLPVKFGTVGGFFSITMNKLSSFENFPREIGGVLNIANNKFASLVGIHKVIKKCESINLAGNKIVEGGMGLLLIEGIKEITTPTNDHVTCGRQRSIESYTHSKDLPFIIISQYVGKGKRGMIDCQTELIKFGCKEFAKL